jgi:hypothetical protein
MAITLGKDVSTEPPFGAGVISATYTEEAETIDISNRSNVGDNVGPGKKVAAVGFTTKTWEIECHDPTGLITALEANATTGWSVMSVSENIGIDGAVTYNVTAKEF